MSGSDLTSGVLCGGHDAELKAHLFSQQDPFPGERDGGVWGQRGTTSEASWCQERPQWRAER